MLFVLPILLSLFENLEAVEKTEPLVIPEKYRQAPDLTTLINMAPVFYHSERTNPHINKFEDGDVRADVPYLYRFHKLRDLFDTRIDGYTLFHISALADVKQIDNPCKLQEDCEPIMTNDDPQMLLYPQCVRVQKCLGGCCNGLKTCNPTGTKTSERTIAKLKYVGSDRFEFVYTGKIYVTEHTGCMCSDCQHNKDNCPVGFELNRNCDCVPKLPKNGKSPKKQPFLLDNKTT